MRCMALIALMMVIIIHMVKIGSVIFLLLAVTIAENSIGNDHDHQEIVFEKSKITHTKSISSK